MTTKITVTEKRCVTTLLTVTKEISKCVALYDSKVRRIFLPFFDYKFLFTFPLPRKGEGRIINSSSAIVLSVGMKKLFAFYL